MSEVIYENEQYRFLLDVIQKEEKDVKEEGKEKTETCMVTTAQITREDRKDGAGLILMSYTWPKQLKVKISVKDAGTIKENGELSFSLWLEVHHIKGMEQGEFTEEQDYTVLYPFEDDIVCSVEDIVRRTRFSIGERHLEHLPHRTYPPVGGKQGPYGHPQIRNLPPIPKRKHT